MQVAMLSRSSSAIAKATEDEDTQRTSNLHPRSAVASPYAVCQSTLAASFQLLILKASRSRPP